MAQSRRELIAAAFNNEKVDRVPVGFWHHFLPDPTVPGFGNTELREQILEAQDTFYHAFPTDILKVMTDGFFHYLNPDVEKKLHSPREALSIRPLGKDSNWYQEQIAYAKELSRRYGKDVQIFYNIFTPQLVFTFSQGNAEEPFNLVPWIKEEPEALKKVLSVIAEDYALLAKGVIEEGGLDGIFFSTNSIAYDAGRLPPWEPHHGLYEPERTPDYLEVTEEEYRDVIAPGELRVLEAARDAQDNNILHICGFNGFRNNLELYRNYPAKAIHWAANVEHLSLAEGKKFFGGRAVIGGFGETQYDLLYKGTQKEIEAETDRLLTETGTVGVVLGADCTVPRDTDINHFRWVREEAERFSRQEK